jgi:hypothetical protein
LTKRSSCCSITLFKYLEDRTRTRRGNLPAAFCLSTARCEAAYPSRVITLGTPCCLRPGRKTVWRVKMDNPPNVALLPCPLCAGPAKLEDTGSGFYHFAVYCQNRYCGCTTALCSTREFAIQIGRDVIGSPKHRFPAIATLATVAWGPAKQNQGRKLQSWLIGAVLFYNMLTGRRVKSRGSVAADNTDKDAAYLPAIVQLKAEGCSGGELPTPTGAVPLVTSWNRITGPSSAGSAPVNISSFWGSLAHRSRWSMCGPIAVNL